MSFLEALDRAEVFLSASKGAGSIEIEEIPAKDDVIEVNSVGVVTSKSSIDKFLSPPITPMKAGAVKSFPIGKEWMYEPKWDGFRCLVFRDEENIFLQSRTGKSLSSAFPEIVAAFRALGPKRFVLDGELALPTEAGFSYDGLVNRLRIGSARLALEVKESPAIYIVFDMLANSENLLGSPFRLRRKTLERFFENSVPRSLPLYLSASTEDLREVEKWVGHIGQQLDGIIAKRADAPYRPGDDRSTVKRGFGNNGTKSPVKPSAQPGKRRLRFGSGVSCNEVHIVLRSR